MIDTHAHIYLKEFDIDRLDIVTKAREEGIDIILMPAIDSESHEKMLQVEAEFDGCLSMMGMHPCSVKGNYKEELELVKGYLQKRRFIAIGEIGLDFYWDLTYKEQQYQAFNQQIELAIKHDLPIAIHSRNAIDECIEVVRQHPTARGVFHCFTGSVTQAKKIIELNFILGIGGVVTFKNAGLDRVIAETGFSSVILETDAPYLAPVPFRGKRNEPAYMKFVLEKLSQISGLPIDEIKQLTTENSQRLFDLKR